MALNIKNVEVERLATEVARLTGESKTEAIRRALQERRRRLKGASTKDRRARVLRFLEKKVWPTLPKAQVGRRLSRAEEDEILGHGPGGVALTPRHSSPSSSEPGYLDLVDRIIEADHVRVGAPTLVETSLVMAGRRPAPGTGEIEGLLTELAITVVPFGEAEWRAAIDAFLRFGRGRHAAALNFGDCLAYASASVAGDTLLFVGDDFGRTDITPA